MTTGTNTIVVPIDFEDASREALSRAQELAVKLGAEVVLVHVYQLPVYAYPGLEPTFVPGFQGEVTTAAKRAMDEVATQAGGLRAMLREGDPATEIVTVAEELGAAMIVMGTHGRKGLAHLLLGSVAEKVVRKSQIPVMTVRTA